MPAVSQAQRAYLNMAMGHQWVRDHGYANKGKLPYHVKSGKKNASKSRKRKAK